MNYRWQRCGGGEDLNLSLAVVCSESWPSYGEKILRNESDSLYMVISSYWWYLTAA